MTTYFNNLKVIVPMYHQKERIILTNVIVQFHIQTINSGLPWPSTVQNPFVVLVYLQTSLVLFTSSWLMTINNVNRLTSFLSDTLKFITNYTWKVNQSAIWKSFSIFGKLFQIQVQMINVVDRPNRRLDVTKFLTEIEQNKTYCCYLNLID